MEKAYIRRINTFLKEWNRFPAHSEADFDCLCNEVATALEDGFGSSDLAAVIQNEFINHFGEPGSVDDVMQISEVIVDWWSSKQSDL